MWTQPLEGWPIGAVLANFTTRYPPWCCKPLLPCGSSLCSVPPVWFPGLAAPPGFHWTLCANLGDRWNQSTYILCRGSSSGRDGLLFQHVSGANSPSCVILSTSLSLTQVSGGSFAGTAPGNAGICLFSITTPLSVVPFDTAESPRPSSLLPVSSWKQKDKIWMQNKWHTTFLYLDPILYPTHDVVMVTSVCVDMLSWTQHCSSETIMMQSRNNL